VAALWKGFSRTANKRKIRARRPPQPVVDGDNGNDDNSSSGSNVDNNKDNNNRDKFKEGKEPMSPELYRCVCKWLLEWGNLDGIYCSSIYHAIVELGLSWQQHSKDLVESFKWSVFDALQVNFKHTKVDQ
jgi:hypothetical protein